MPLVACDTCGRKNAPQRATCLFCGSELPNSSQPIIPRRPSQKVVVVVAALLLAVALLYRFMPSAPDRGRNVKTEIAGLKEQRQTPIESGGKGIESDQAPSGPTVVANTPIPSYPVDAEHSGARSVGGMPASSKPAACEYVVNPKTGHITTARRVPAYSGYVPVKLKPGNTSGSYIDPVTGNETFVPLTRAPNPFAATVRASQVALCDRHERGEISTAEFDDLFNNVKARVQEASQKHAEGLQRLAIEQQKLALEREKLEMQRRALAAQIQAAQQAQQMQWQAAQRAQEIQQQKLYLDALMQRQALEAQRQAQERAAQQARDNIIMQEVLRGIFRPKQQQSANCRVVPNGNQYQVDCW